MKINLYGKVAVYLFLIFNLAVSHAQLSCDLGTDDAPSPTAIACIIGRIINIATLVGGMAFVAMVGYGAAKLAMAAGSPKGYEGAKNTWQWALIGAFTIAGVYMILSVVGKLFGFSISPTDMVSGFSNAIQTLMDYAVQGDGGGPNP